MVSHTKEVKFSSGTREFDLIDDFYEKLDGDYTYGTWSKEKHWSSSQDNRRYSSDMYAETVMREEYGLIYHEEPEEQDYGGGHRFQMWLRSEWEVVDVDRFLLFKLTYM